MNPDTDPAVPGKDRPAEPAEMGARRAGTVPSRPTGRELPRIEPPLADDTINPEAFSRRLVNLCLRMQLPGLPRKRRDRAILLKSITLLLDPGKRYTQREFDEVLKSWLHEIGRRLKTDHAALRRHLVDAGFVRRTPDGSAYQIESSSRLRVPFAAEVDALDVRAIIAVGAADIEARKRAHARRQEKEKHPPSR